MPMSSITERVLAARERGFTDEAISAYEEVPLSDVEQIVEAYQPPIESDSDREVRLETTQFLETEGYHEITEFVEDVQQRARVAGVDVVKEAAIELVHRYHVDPDVALNAIERINRADRLAEIELTDRDVRLERVIDRIRQR